METEQNTTNEQGESSGEDNNFFDLGIKDFEMDFGNFEFQDPFQDIDFNLEFDF